MYEHKLLQYVLGMDQIDQEVFTCSVLLEHAHLFVIHWAVRIPDYADEGLGFQLRQIKRIEVLGHERGQLDENIT